MKPSTNTRAPSAALSVPVMPQLLLEPPPGMGLGVPGGVLPMNAAVVRAGTANAPVLESNEIARYGRRTTWRQETRGKTVRSTGLP